MRHPSPRPRRPRPARRPLCLEQLESRESPTTFLGALADPWAACDLSVLDPDLTAAEARKYPAPRADEPRGEPADREPAGSFTVGQPATGTASDTSPPVTVAPDWFGQGEGNPLLSDPFGDPFP